MITCQVRISLISPDGAVCYDNEVEVNSLDNHNNRPEVEQALHNGEGSSVRKSDTIDKNAFLLCTENRKWLYNQGC